MTEKPKSKWHWRVLRWGLIGLAVLATLVAILVAEEDWRAKRAWETYRHEAEARGESFNLAAIVPPVPDGQNFYAAPIVAEALKAARNQGGDAVAGSGAKLENRLDFNLCRGDSKIWPTEGGNWQRGTLSDLTQWQQYFRAYNETPEGKTNGFPATASPQTPAADILLALSPGQPAIEELRQASFRPQMRVPLDYAQGFEVVGDLLPWLANEKRCVRLLELRALAELQAGQSQQAIDDVKLLLRLADSLREQPFLISHLVRIAMMNVSLEPVYEGLAQHRWNETQLADLQTKLEAEDFLADFGTAMRGERTCAIESFETQRLTRQMRSTAIVSGTEVIVTNSLRWMPAAYFYQNELAFSRMHEQVILPMVNVGAHTVSVAAFRASDADNKKLMKQFWPYSTQALMVFPAVGKSAVKFAAIQGSVDLARVAVGLERYRLAHGEYPVTLDALAPQFIPTVPHDIISGQSLHYRRTDGGKVLLYSVGWNETDDGGTVGSKKDGRLDPEQGDWVWKY